MLASDLTLSSAAKIVFVAGQSATRKNASEILLWSAVFLGKCFHKLHI